LKTVVYKAKGDFEGTASVEIPSRKNRVKLYLKHLGETATGSELGGASLYDELYTVAEKAVTEVKIKNKDGKAYKSFAAMSEDSLCDDVCEDIIKLLMDGEQLGEG
jgi:hypothetical protein